MKIVIAMGIALSLSGCVNMKNAPLTEEAKQALPGKSVVQVIQAKPDFAMFKTGHMMFGVIGALAAVSDGNRLVKENAIEDPATIVSNKLADKLQTGYSVIRQETETPVLDMDNISQLSAEFADNDYVLHVQTVSWSAVYLPTNWMRYRVVYTTKARLIDTKKVNVVAESGCVRQQWSGDTETFPTSDELLADNAMRLKQTLVEHAESCSEEMGKHMFSL